MTIGTEGEGHSLPSLPPRNEQQQNKSSMLSSCYMLFFPLVIMFLSKGYSFKDNVVNNYNINIYHADKQLVFFN